MTTPHTLTLDDLIHELSELRDRLGTGRYDTGVLDVVTDPNPDSGPRVELTPRFDADDWEEGYESGFRSGMKKMHDDLFPTIFDLRWKTLKRDGFPKPIDADEEGMVEWWAKGEEPWTDFRERPENATHWRSILTPDTDFYRKNKFLLA